jgi:hypothetical protein
VRGALGREDSMQLDLTDEAAALLRELNNLIENDRLSVVTTN